jgi:endonuclease YncB( thermonuclease family)
MLIIFLGASTGFAWQGKVVRVIDGDTVVVLNVDKQQTKVRLYGIDSPEKKQAFGTKAKQFLSSLIYGKVVDVVDLGNDMYGRTVGKIYFDSQYINLTMVERGYGWHYRRYAPRDSELSLAQDHAKQQQLGLWSDPTVVEPWNYRKKSKKGD